MSEQRARVIVMEASKLGEDPVQALIDAGYSALDAYRIVSEILDEILGDFDGRE